MLVCSYSSMCTAAFPVAFWFNHNYKAMLEQTFIHCNFFKPGTFRDCYHGTITDFWYNLLAFVAFWCSLKSSFFIGFWRNFFWTPLILGWKVDFCDQNFCKLKGLKIRPKINRFLHIIHDPEFSDFTELQSLNLWA